MKKFGLFLLAAVMTSVFAACNKDSKQTIVSFNVQVNVEERFAEAPLDVVIAHNKTTNTTTSAEIVDGVASFQDVYAGVYDFSVSAEWNNLIISAIKKDVVISLNAEGKVDDVVLETTAQAKSALVISKAYVNGTKKNNGTNYNMPKYWEIFNNSAETVYLDGLCIAQAHGNTTAKNTCQLYVEDKTATYASRIARMEGEHGVTKNIPLEAGKSIVIAWNAQNFIIDDGNESTQMTMNVDLTNADYEIYTTQAMWVQNENIPDIQPVYDCLPTAGFLQMNQAVFIFFASAEDIEEWETKSDETSYSAASQKAWKAKRVPNDIILDAVEVVKKGATQQKRVADAVDAAFIEETNNAGSIVERKIKEVIDGRVVLVDTNSSKDDFVVIESRNPEAYDGSHLTPKDYSKPEIQPAQ